ncbi:MAG: 3-dehydroquinate synthase, partial [Gammaproteobacteria bacterium]|nr:3-dehydroquinate synthase [Gammaproteobacteria bacterium]
METLSVDLGSRSYPILIGEGLLGERSLFEQHLRARELLIVSNTVVAPLYLNVLEASLEPRRVVAAILPDGESHKTLANVGRI